MITPYPKRGAVGPLAALLAGGISALALGVALSHANSLLIFLSYLTALPIFVVGLATGGANALIASAIGMGVLLFATAPTVVLIYALIFVVPASGLVFLALRYRRSDDGKVYWYPEGYLLTALTLYACLLFLTIAATAAGPDGGLLTITTRLLNEALPQITAQQPPETAARIAEAIPQLARILPALVGCSWIFLMMISGFVGHIIVKQQNWHIRDVFELKSIVIPQWLIAAAALTGLAGFFAPGDYGYLATNVCMMLSLPFFFVGLAVMHVFAGRQKAPMWVLIPFYVVLTLLPQLGLFVALLGAFDQGLNLRQRLQRRLPLV
jgi:uncharacterized protein YybS (DUF2232 family)